MADICLFMSTMLLYKSLCRLPKSTDYASTLNKLFRPASTASRHLESKSTSELFEIRKRLFQEVYNDNMPRDCSVIHVAGTKGKGSTVEYISSALINSGEKVGVFTSPHLHTARERLKFGRRLISKEDMVHFGNISLTLMQKFSSAVFFDVLLTTALLYFGRKDVSYLVMESGIGGRYDSTNFVEAPVACVICSISLDHQGTLGETIEEIAWQKAGIIKRGSHVFTPSTQKPGVLEVFRRQCRAMEATLHVVDVDRRKVGSLNVNLSYEVQLENACLALAVLEHLRVPSGGMRDFYWPCRMERFRLRGLDVILDGCHNGDSVHHFLRGLASKFPSKRLVLVFGAGLEKCLDTMIRELLSAPPNALGADLSLLLVQSRHFKSLSEHELLQRIPAADRARRVVGLTAAQLRDSSGLVRQADGTVPTRLQWAIEQYGDGGGDSAQCDAAEGTVIAVCGSLFVAAEAREHLFSVDPALFSASDWVRERDPLE